MKLFACVHFIPSRILPHGLPLITESYLFPFSRIGKVTLNSSKTEFLLTGLRKQLVKPTTHSTPLTLLETSASYSMNTSLFLTRSHQSLNLAITIFVSISYLVSYRKVNRVQQFATRLNATGTHVPRGITVTQCYLPLSKGDIPALPQPKLVLD